MNVFDEQMSCVEELRFDSVIKSKFQFDEPSASRYGMRQYSNWKRKRVRMPRR